MKKTKAPTRTIRRSSGADAIIPLAIGGALLGGCVTVEDRPQARPVEDAAPVQIFFARGNPTDSDGDGYADTIPVTVYLYPDRRVSELPVWADGTFTLTLSTLDGRQIDQWVFPPDIVEQSRRTASPGRCFGFFLRLGGDTDHMPPTTADIRVAFVGTDGRELPVAGPVSLQLGGF